MNPETPYPPVILLSGMGADARVFARQMEAIPQIMVPEWIPPMQKDSLASYAERLAREVSPGQPCYLGGASFGGFVAQEMLPHLDVLGCILIGSVRSPDEFPPSVKALKAVSPPAGVLPFEVASLMSRAALMSSGSLSGAHLKDLLGQMSDSDAAFLRWACGAVLKWEGPREVRVPIHHIHGGRDIVLPARYTRPDVVVSGAGHALSMSHPDEVTEFISHVVEGRGYART